MKSRSIKIAFILFIIHALLSVITFNQKNGGGLEFMWMMFFNAPIMIGLKHIYENNDSTSLLYVLSVLGSIHWFFVGYIISVIIENFLKIKKFSMMILTYLATFIIYVACLFKLFVSYYE